MGLEKPNSDRDRGRGETFFANSGSDLDSDETFQISRNVGLDIVEIVCLLDSQLWSEIYFHNYVILGNYYTVSWRLRIFNCIEEVPRFFFPIEFNSTF